jgi:hypothetical protein
VEVDIFDVLLHGNNSNKNDEELRNDFYFESFDQEDNINHNDLAGYVDYNDRPANIFQNGNVNGNNFIKRVY